MNKALSLVIRRQWVPFGNICCQGFEVELAAKHKTNFRLCSTSKGKKMVNPNKFKIATYDEVKDLPNHPEVLLIDVREAKELKETGVIPSSIHIPLKEIENVMKNTSTEKFQSKYGRKKPGSTEPIICSCRSGARANTACEILEKQGYTNLKNYKGSWLEWAEKNKLSK